MEISRSESRAILYASRSKSRGIARDLLAILNLKRSRATIKARIRNRAILNIFHLKLWPILNITRSTSREIYRAAASESSLTVGQRKIRPSEWRETKKGKRNECM